MLGVHFRFHESLNYFCFLCFIIFEQAPRSLLSLGAMLDEYICLKEQKVFLEQEKMQVQNLLRGMQGVMNIYNASAKVTPPPSIPASSLPKSAGFNSVCLFLFLTVLPKA